MMLKYYFQLECCDSIFSLLSRALQYINKAEVLYYSTRMTFPHAYWLISGRLPVQLFQSHPLFTRKIIALDIKSDHIFANGPQMKSDQGTLNCYLQTNPGMLKGLCAWCEQLIIKGNPTSRVDWIIAPDSFPLLLAEQNNKIII